MKEYMIVIKDEKGRVVATFRVTANSSSDALRQCSNVIASYPDNYKVEVR